MRERASTLKNLDDKIRRFALTEDEQKDLIAFLESLTDESNLPGASGARAFGPARGAAAPQERLTEGG